MENFQIIKITDKDILSEAINFIHHHNFSLETSSEKICNNFDGRILGLIIKSIEKNVAGVIFYYYQPKIKIKETNYKVINFSTIYIKEQYRGKGLLSLMLKETKELFSDYIITGYTLDPKVRHISSKLGFNYMKNYRSLILPMPKLKSIFSLKIGKINKIIDIETYDEIFKKLENYRKYEITLWRYKKNNIDILFGTTFNNHERDFFKFKMKSSSVRILWTNDEKVFLEEVNNIAFLFLLKLGHKFLTIDCESSKRPFFSMKLDNQFMIFPKLDARVSPIGSEFFSGVI
tara:strand:- start:177 stop:1043 length:867 start_codon:yes stop_codon:yes gene_type:complete